MENEKFWFQNLIKSSDRIHGKPATYSPYFINLTAESWNEKNSLFAFNFNFQSIIFQYSIAGFHGGEMIINYRDRWTEIYWLAYQWEKEVFGLMVSVVFVGFITRVVLLFLLAFRRKWKKYWKLESLKKAWKSSQKSTQFKKLEKA
jgi:hypothetical protein